MGNYTFFYMFENPRRGRQARNFTTNVPKILHLKSSSEQIFSEIDVGAPDTTFEQPAVPCLMASCKQCKVLKRVLLRSILFQS